MAYTETMASNAPTEPPQISHEAEKMENQTFISMHELHADAKIVYISESVQDLLGYEPSEVIGKSPFDYFIGKQAEAARKQHGRGVQMDKAAVLTKWNLRSKSGEIIPCECVFTVVYSVVVAATSLLRETTFQSRRNEAKEITRKFEPVARQFEPLKQDIDMRCEMIKHLSSKFISPSSGQNEPRAALFLNRFTRSLCILYCTEAVSDMLGISPEEMTGKSFLECIHDDDVDQATEAIEQAKENDSITYLRFRWRDPRGPGGRRSSRRQHGLAGNGRSYANGSRASASRNGANGDSSASTNGSSTNGSSTNGSSTNGSSTNGFSTNGFSTNDSSTNDSSTNGNTGTNGNILRTEAYSTLPGQNSSSGPFDGYEYEHETDGSESGDNSTDEEDEEDDGDEEVLSEGDNGQDEEDLDSFHARSRPPPMFQNVYVECVISCTSDGLVAVLRRSRVHEEHEAIAAWAPWSHQPIIPTETTEQNGHDNSHQLDFMESIRQIAAFAWNCAAIHNEVRQYAKRNVEYDYAQDSEYNSAESNAIAGSSNTKDNGSHNNDNACIDSTTKPSEGVNKRKRA